MERAVKFYNAVFDIEIQVQDFRSELTGCFFIEGEEDAVRRLLIHKKIDYRYIRDVNRFFLK